MEATVVGSDKMQGRAEKRGDGGRDHAHLQAVHGRYAGDGGEAHPLAGGSAAVAPVIPIIGSARMVSQFSSGSHARNGSRRIASLNCRIEPFTVSCFLIRDLESYRQIIGWYWLRHQKMDRAQIAEHAVNASQG